MDARRSSNGRRKVNHLRQVGRDRRDHGPPQELARDRLAPDVEDIGTDLWNSLPGRSPHNRPENGVTMVARTDRTDAPKRSERILSRKCSRSVT